MKKNILMISAAMLALVSCTQDEVVQINNGQKIEFRTALDTRATELTNDDLQSFHVTALYGDVVYFSDVFSKDDTDNSFKSTTDYYWPATEEVKFYAYYPYGNDLPGTVSINANQKKVTGFTPASVIASQVDFVTAFEVYTKSQAENGSVGIEFQHQLSQIAIHAKNSNEGYQIKVKAVRIKNVVGSGDFDFSAAVANWTPNTDLASYEVSHESAITLTAEIAQSLMGNQGNAMLIPQTSIKWAPKTPVEPEGQNDGEGLGGEDGSLGETGTPETGGDNAAGDTTERTSPDGSYIAFLIQIETATGIRVFPTAEGVDYAWVAKPLAFNWQPGYKYTYEFDFKDGAGVIAPDNFEDPDGPDGPKDPILPGGDEDDPKPGDNVYGGKIVVDVTFGGWNYNYSDDNVYNSDHTLPMTSTQSGE